MKSCGYNVYDCLYWKGKLNGYGCPDGCYCPVLQKSERRNGIEQFYATDADSFVPILECEGRPCIGWCTREVMRTIGLPRSVTKIMYDYVYGADEE